MAMTAGANMPAGCWLKYWDIGIPMRAQWHETPTATPNSCTRLRTRIALLADRFRGEVRNKAANKARKEVACKHGSLGSMADNIMDDYEEER